MTRNMRVWSGAIAASLVLMTLGCASGVEAPSPPVSGPRTSGSADGLGTAAHPARVAVVGDSLTSGGGARDVGEGLNERTWMTYAKGDGVIYVGGWAVGGATVETMASSVGRMSHVDVLVVMGGTNDVRRGIPFDAAASSYKAIVSKVRPTSVLIADIPPYDGDPQAAARFSEELRRYASVQGWDFSDPWVFARDEDRYKQGASLDGTHPTISGYRKLGYELRIAILRVASYTVSG